VIGIPAATGPAAQAAPVTIANNDNFVFDQRVAATVENSDTTGRRSSLGSPASSLWPRRLMNVTQSRRSANDSSLDPLLTPVNHDMTWTAVHVADLHANDFFIR
jgi:hypothetical protein